MSNLGYSEQVRGLWWQSTMTSGDELTTVPLVDGLAERKVRAGRALRGHWRMGRAATPSRPRAGGLELVSPVDGVGAGELPRRRGRRTAAAHWGRTSRSTSPGSRPRCAPPGIRSVEEYELEDAPERVEVQLLPGQHASPAPAVPLPGDMLDRACGGLRPQGGPGEGEHRGAAAGRGSA